RRTPRQEMVIDFEGDPEVDSVAFDTAVMLDPHELSFEAAPGATRTNTIAITNPGDQSVSLEISLETPKALQRVAMGELLGEDLSAAPWTDVRPAELTIRPGQRRNVRLISRLPKEGADNPHYYA